MNTFIHWQETISDAYLTDTPPYFLFIVLNISPLPQESLASIPSNALIMKSDGFLLVFTRNYHKTITFPTYDFGMVLINFFQSSSIRQYFVTEFDTFDADQEHLISMELNIIYCKENKFSLLIAEYLTQNHT